VATPSFTFRLERVRALRERREDVAREELAAGLAHRLRGEALLRQAAEAAQAAHRSSRGTVTAAGISGSDLLAAQAWLERSERRREDAALDLDRRDAEVEMRRRSLAAAARDREAIERLKRRRRAEHDREWERREQVALDEVALNVHRRGAAAR
jgi:flagellar FliJ protein